MPSPVTAALWGHMGHFTLRMRAPLPEVKHKGETYVVSTPGQEYQAVVQLPARGGGGGYWGGGGASKGYVVELDIDGKLARPARHRGR